MENNIEAARRQDTFREERRREILHTVNREGKVIVRSLAQKFAISHVTIRQDLNVLHQEGLLHRTYGGALTIQSPASMDRNPGEKEMLHWEEKRRIAAAAARLVREGESVVLGSGSTATALARELRNFRSLTVITNSVEIATELAGTALEVILTGGIMRGDSISLVGPLTEDTLRELSAEISFLAVDGFDIHIGLTTRNLLEARVIWAMMKISRCRVVVCDSSKFGSRSLSQIAPLSAVHKVITDRGISESDLRSLKEAGIETVVV